MNNIEIKTDFNEPSLNKIISKTIEEVKENPTKSTLKKRGDYKDWQENWIISDNSIIEELAELGYNFYMDEKGDLTYSVDNGEEKTVSRDKASHFLSNKLGRKIKFFNYEDEAVKPYDIIGITGRMFNPFIHQRFIEIKKRRYVKNEFTPSYYMNLIEKPVKETPAILSLIGNLVNNDETKKHYFINWLAYFFQTLKRPQTAIVLKGRQGAGKDTIFDNVIAPLFGEKQTIKIDDRTIESNFNANTFKNKLFIGFNETSKGNRNSNKDIKNFLKQIITNNEATLEEKHKTREKVSLHFACLFFTNEAKFIEIEPNDRRFNVFLTGDNLSKSDFLGYGDFYNLIDNIKKELEDFARYLYHFEVDRDLANKAINTPEKEAVINATTPKLILFYEALKNKNLEYFSPLEELEEDEMLPAKTRNLFSEVKTSFVKGMIKKSLLKKVYENLYETKISSQTLYKELRAIDPDFLHRTNEIKDQNGARYINLL
jgi:hypothetical protein